MKRPRKEPC